MGEGALSKLLAGKVYDYLGFSLVSSTATGALAPFRKSHVSLPRQLCLAHICGDVTLSFLDVFAQRMLLSKKDHQERVTHEGLSNIYYDPLLSHNDWVCSALSSKVVPSRFLLESKCQSGLFCVCRKNLSLRLVLDARRSNQHCRVPPKFSMATGDSFSRVEFLIGNPHGGEALVLQIAPVDV